MHIHVLDTETASLEGGVCDIAIAVLNDDLDIIWEVESLIDPERPIAPQASGIHHITDDMVWTAPTLAEFMEMHGHPFKVPGLVIAGHNCVTGDHEVFTRGGWRRFDSIDSPTVDALVWDPATEGLSFHTCPVIRREHRGEMIEWSTQYHKGCYTPDHRVYFRTTSQPSQEWRVGTSSEVARMGQNNVLLPVSGIFRSEEEVPLSPIEARVMEMIRADGYIDGGAARFSFKKQAKIERCRDLLAQLGVKFSSSLRDDGATRIRAFKCDAIEKIIRLLQQSGPKGYGPWLLDLPLLTRLALLDELDKWDGIRPTDGSKSQIRLSTVDRLTAESLCDMAILSGFSAKNRFDIPNSRGFSREDGIIHEVLVRSRPQVKLVEGPRNVQWDGDVYCLTTPTGAFLVRRMGATWITGNCQFDIRMVKDQLPEVFGRLCTLKLARNLWPDAPDHKLQTLRYMFKLDAGTAHRAMGDVYACVNLLRRIAEEHQCRLDGLMELGRAPLSLNSRLPFGKHKGDKLKDIPMSYVRWLLTLADLDADLREALSTRTT